MKRVFETATFFFICGLCSQLLCAQLYGQVLELNEPTAELKKDMTIDQLLDLVSAEEKVVEEINRVEGETKPIQLTEPEVAPVPNPLELAAPNSNKVAPPKSDKVDAEESELVEPPSRPEPELGNVPAMSREVVELSLIHI